MIEEVFSCEHSNFLSRTPIEGLMVKKGENLLHTSFQYSVREGRGKPLLTVKFYDKLVDLISREGTHPVGGRISQIVGAKRTLTAFE